MSGQEKKSRQFRALHERDGVFIFHNPWDVDIGLFELTTGKIGQSRHS